MYDAFNWKPPAFAHVGLLTDQNHQKLSKRNMDIDISAFRDKMGVFPETLTNYVALLGWSHEKRKDVMDLQELISNVRHTLSLVLLVLIPLQFTMKFTTGDTVVTLEKLWYLQRAHAERYAKPDTTGHGAKMLLMTEPILKVLRDRNWIDSTNCVLGYHNAESYVAKLVQLDARNYTNASSFVDRNKYFFHTPDEQVLLSSRPSGHLHHMPRGVELVVQDGIFREVLSGLKLIPLEEWTTPRVRDYINATITEKAEQSVEQSRKNHVLDLEEVRKTAPKSWSKLIHSYIRWAIATGLPGPDGAESMNILGREETLARLASAARVLKLGRSDGGADLDAEVIEAHKPT